MFCLDIMNANYLFVSSFPFKMPIKEQNQGSLRFLLNGQPPQNLAKSLPPYQTSTRGRRDKHTHYIQKCRQYFLLPHSRANPLVGYVSISVSVISTIKYVNIFLDQNVINFSPAISARRNSPVQPNMRRHSWMSSKWQKAQNQDAIVYKYCLTQSKSSVKRADR